MRKTRHPYRQLLKSSGSPAGFTIIELMIASAVFSVILIVCALTMVHISRIYYKGVNNAKVQETARAVMDEIARDIQFSGGSVTPTPSPTAGFFCVGDRRYSYLVDTQVIDGGSHALVVDKISNCNTTTGSQVLSGGALLPESRELLGERMRLQELKVEESLTGSGSWGVTVTVIYGDDEVLNTNHDACNSSNAGGQFCAISNISTTVQKRIN